MTDALADIDNDGEEYGPSLALPPLYVLRAAARCPECSQGQHVYTLGCAAFHDGEDLRPVEEFHFLRLIQSVAEPVLNLLKDRCTGYFFDEARAGEGGRYLMNHCQCGARIDDDYLHGDVGTAFWPDTPEGYGALRLFRIPIDEAIPVECSYTLGGGEYLDFAKGELW